MQFTVLSLLPILLPLISASPVPGDTLDSRQSATTCGSNSYTVSQVSNAADAACDFVGSGTTAGSSTYPHQYKNFEGFSFLVDGPYYEFPLLESHVYSGGSPGADRVIINANCEVAGEITHTGASGNNFVGCDGTN